MKQRPIIISLLVLVAIVFLMIRFLDTPKKMEYKFYPMGGIPCKIVEYDRSAEEFAEDTKEAEARVSDLEQILSNYRPDSEVSKVNAAKSNVWIPVSPDFYKVLENSLVWYGKTDGAFDVTIVPLINLWKKSQGEGRVPTAVEIKSALAHVGSSHITLSKDKGIKFSRGGMELDFGGIAKGYILDKIGQLLTSRGVNKYVVSCGGDVVMRGKKAFRVGVQEPGEIESNLMMILNAPPGGVVTSGHYARFFKIDGHEYSHIIDPATGWPAEKTLASITVWGEKAEDADALATALAVFGLKNAIEFLKRSDDYSGIFLAKAGEGYEIHYSKSLADKIEFIGKWKDVPRVEF